MIKKHNSLLPNQLLNPNRLIKALKVKRTDLKINECNSTFTNAEYTSKSRVAQLAA